MSLVFSFVVLTVMYALTTGSCLRSPHRVKQASV